MKQSSGFTVLELLTVVAITAVLSTIAIPNFVSWRNNTRFRGSVNTLNSDLAVAKQTAIRLNQRVTIRFNDTRYTIFVDDGAGTVDTDGDGVLDGFANGSRDGTERIIQQRDMAAGVTISDITFPGDFTVFNGRGRCPSANVGSVVLNDNSHSQSTVSINRLGRVRVS